MCRYVKNAPLIWFASLNFNIVSKGLGSEKMSYYLAEAAGDIRDLLMPTIEAAKAKL